MTLAKFLFYKPSYHHQLDRFVLISDSGNLQSFFFTNQAGSSLDCFVLISDSGDLQGIW